MKGGNNYKAGCIAAIITCCIAFLYVQMAVQLVLNRIPGVEVCDATIAEYRVEDDSIIIYSPFMFTFRFPRFFQTSFAQKYNFVLNDVIEPYCKGMKQDFGVCIAFDVVGGPVQFFYDGLLLADIGQFIKAD